MLSAPDKFFAALKASKLLGDTLSQDEVNGCNALLKACGDAKWPVSWAAYAVATAYHECAHTMQPIKEKGGEAYFTRMYDIKGNNPGLAMRLGNDQPGDGARFAGRGYVQLTGRNNYERADAALGLGGALVSNPDIAMRPDIAASIMTRGMSAGWFTGKALKDFLPIGPAARMNFVLARRIINGTDRDEMIADYAMEFQKALLAGGWK